MELEVVGRWWQLAVTGSDVLALPKGAYRPTKQVGSLWLHTPFASSQDILCLTDVDHAVFYWREEPVEDLSSGSILFWLPRAAMDVTSAMKWEDQVRLADPLAFLSPGMQIADGQLTVDR